MRPTLTQRNMIDKDPLAKHRIFKHMTQNALHIRATIATNWLATTIRNYIQTIEGDMDYAKSNQPTKEGREGSNERKQAVSLRKGYPRRKSNPVV